MHITPETVVRAFVAVAAQYVAGRLLEAADRRLHRAGANVLYRCRLALNRRTAGENNAD